MIGNSLPKLTSNISPTVPFFAASATGFANSDGIVFSSIPTSTPIPAFVFSNPYQAQLSKPVHVSEQSSNAHYATNSNTNYVHPISIPAPQLQTSTVKSQEHHVSPGFTFAPLVATISIPIIPLQTGNLTVQQNCPNDQVFVSQPQPAPPPSPSPPTIPKLPLMNQNLTISALRTHKCGVTKYTNSRVVGGAITQIGIQSNFPEK